MDETQMEMFDRQFEKVDATFERQSVLIGLLRERGLSLGHADKLLDVCQWIQSHQKIPATFQQRAHYP